MPLETQGKIVRALQDQAFERIGGAARVKVDVRVLASTNRDLSAEIAAGASGKIFITVSPSSRFKFPACESVGRTYRPRAAFPETICREFGPAAA